MTDPSPVVPSATLPRAAAPRGGGVTELGTPIPIRRQPRWGFHVHNELLHGRIAMLGFIALLAVEWKLGHGILIWP
jgi:hypothetical protein